MPMTRVAATVAAVVVALVVVPGSLPRPLSSENRVHDCGQYPQQGGCQQAGRR